MGTGSHKPSVEIDGQTIRELLEELNEKLAEHDVYGEMYVVGGAAMVLTYESIRSTSDIDCVITNGSDRIHDAAAEIAQERPGLGADWLNETAATAHNIPEDPDEESRAAYQGSHLTVKTASPERMLAMKIHADRTSDHEDIEQLVRFTRIESGEEAKRITEHYFPHSEVPAETVKVVEDAIAKDRARAHLTVATERKALQVGGDPTVRVPPPRPQTTQGNGSDGQRRPKPGNGGYEH